MDHVVYGVECPCGKLYIGQTTRPLSVRIREHIYNIKKRITTHNLSAHFLKEHGADPGGLKFWGIEKSWTHWRGSNKLRELSKRQSFWIYKLETLEPKGLNVEFDLNCFISNSWGSIVRLLEVLGRVPPLNMTHSKGSMVLRTFHAIDIYLWYLYTLFYLLTQILWYNIHFNIYFAMFYHF